jgi:dipeptidyl aminopeptidase/acylaminoacyl peptidase
VFWLWLLLGLALTLAALAVAGAIAFHLWILRQYLDYLVRIFTEKPLFIIPRGEAVTDAEEVTFANADGQRLRGCYLRTSAAERQGVILFGLEFGSTRWASVPYCQFLRAAGFDVFSFEPRSQGESDRQDGYEPLQWVTTYEVRDCQAALAYLRGRPDADPRGIGLFGISKGGGAGLLAATGDSYVRCCVTDGVFAIHTTMLPYMRKWITIYSNRKLIQVLLPDWYYSLVASTALRRVQRERHCRFPHLERRIHRLAPRPLLMIHGGADTYIKPEMAQALFERARGPKELWLVEGAKHNQAFHLANGDYQGRVLAFFEKYLGTRLPAPSPAVNGQAVTSAAEPVTAPH